MSEDAEPAPLSELEQLRAELYVLKSWVSKVIRPIQKREIAANEARFAAIEARLGPSKDQIKRERAIAAGLRFDVLRRDGFKCTYCGERGTKRTLRVDHVVPVSKGGKSTLSNLTTACDPCNSGKSNKSVSVG